MQLGYWTDSHIHHVYTSGIITVYHSILQYITVYHSIPQYTSIRTCLLLRLCVLTPCVSNTRPCIQQQCMINELNLHIWISHLPGLVTYCRLSRFSYNLERSYQHWRRALLSVNYILLTTADLYNCMCHSLMYATHIPWRLQAWRTWRLEVASLCVQPLHSPPTAAGFATKQHTVMM